MANTKRMNRLEELGRVDSEKAYTKKGKKNLKAEKKRIVNEVSKKNMGGSMGGGMNPMMMASIMAGLGGGAGPTNVAGGGSPYNNVGGAVPANATEPGMWDKFSNWAGNTWDSMTAPRPTGGNIDPKYTGMPGPRFGPTLGQTPNELQMNNVNDWGQSNNQFRQSHGPGRQWAHTLPQTRQNTIMPRRAVNMGVHEYPSINW